MPDDVSVSTTVSLHPGAAFKVDATDPPCWFLWLGASPYGVLVAFHDPDDVRHLRDALTAALDEAQPEAAPDFTSSRPNPDAHPGGLLPGEPEDCNPSRYFPEDRR